MLRACVCVCVKESLKTLGLLLSNRNLKEIKMEDISTFILKITYSSFNLLNSLYYIFFIYLCKMNK